MNSRKLRLGLIGTGSLIGKEIKNLLSEKPFPLENMEFFDPDVEEEFSKLTEFRGEAKIVSPLSASSLEGLDVVFLASVTRVNRQYAKLAKQLGYVAIALGRDFEEDPNVPAIVAGINDDSALQKKPSVVANPHPVAVLLSHIFFALQQESLIQKAAATVLQPFSVCDEAGIEELAGQSLGMLQSTSVTKKIFRAQAAFNLLSQTSSVDERGFSPLEYRIVQEVRAVLSQARMPLTVSMLQAPVFHSYSLMMYLELKADLTLKTLASVFKNSPSIKYFLPSLSCPVSPVAVSGHDRIFVGQLKKCESLPRGFWLWAAADNLTFGSALNAYEIAKNLASM